MSMNGRCSITIFVVSSLILRLEKSHAFPSLLLTVRSSANPPLSPFLFASAVILGGEYISAMSGFSEFGSLE